MLLWSTGPYYVDIFDENEYDENDDDDDEKNEDECACIMHLNKLLLFISYQSVMLIIAITKFKELSLKKKIKPSIIHNAENHRNVIFNTNAPSKFILHIIKHNCWAFLCAIHL